MNNQSDLLNQMGLDSLDQMRVFKPFWTQTHEGPDLYRSYRFNRAYIADTIEGTFQISFHTN